MPEVPNGKAEIEANPSPEESDSDEYYHIPKLPISRRRFLQWGTLTAGTAALTLFLERFGFLGNNNPNPSENPTPSASPSEQPTPSESLPTGKKNDLSLKEFGLKWTPDGHISYFTTPESKKRYFISAADSTWMIETDGQKSLKDYILSKELTQEQFHEVLKPYESPDKFNPDGGYNNGYTGITNILQTDKNNPMHLMGITHCEQRKHINDSGTYTASVGLVESTDSGLTWTDKGPIIKGRAPIPPGEKPSGAGQPAAIIKDGYVHIIYIEWNTGGDELYSAKMKINDDGSLGNVEDIKDNNGELKPVIPMPEGTGYAALPSLSYNEELQKYLCVFLTNLGFYETTSDDLINWGNAKMIFSFADNNSAPDGETLKSGQEYIYYPTYLSEDRKDDHTTGKSGELYYSSRLIGPDGDGEHNLKSVDLQLTA
jgi:hypothetical protein